MKKNRNIPHNVLVVQSLRYKSSRELLAGILDGMADKDWLLTVSRPGDILSPRDLVNEDGDPYDGFILPVPCADDVMKRLARLDTPTVLVNITDKRLSAERENFATVWTDNADIGRKAAQHLLERGEYRSAAYTHGEVPRFYSDERMRAFRQTMRRGGYETAVLPVCNGYEEWTDCLRQFLKKLPKPAAVMVVADMCAADLINICREEGFAVPDQIAVVGVDHDVSQHARCGMSISSVAADMKQIGRLAVMELDFLFRHPGWKGRPHEILVPAKEVFGGESTNRRATSGARLVEEAQSFIAANRTRRLSPTDVAAQLGCSHSLLKLRFRQSAGMTLREAIEKARLEEAHRRLQGGESVKDVVTAMHFTSANQLYRIYKRHFGHTIRAYRQR